MSYQGQILLDAGTNELEIVEFEIQIPSSHGGPATTGYYGIHVAKVKAIVTVPEILAFPNSHPAVVGAMNLRGKVISLINLSIWLGFEGGVGKKSRVIVTEFNNLVCGFIVDSVNRIHRISWEQFVPPPSDISLDAGGCLTSVVRIQDHLILMLDFESIIADINPAFSIGHSVPPTPEGLDRDQRLILVAEDSTAIRGVLVRYLKEAGYQVTPFENGEAALEYLTESATGNHRIPDLVISDIEMPRMDGMHLLSRIKTESALKHLPVIMFSSLGSDANRAKAMKLGAADLISKPDIHRLVDLVDKTILDYQSAPIEGEIEDEVLD